MSFLLPLARRTMSLLPSAVPRRQRRLAGDNALVDGIQFSMPVNSEDTPALMAAFTIDATKAAALLPGRELHPVRMADGRGLLVVTVVNYVITDIGKYIEYSLAIACTHGSRPAPRLLPGLFRGHYGTGQYVVDLPVSSEVSVKGGKGIWGMPKHQANLDFTVTDHKVASQYEVDGLLGCLIEIDRPPPSGLPLRVGAVNYCAFRGLLMKSSIYFEAAADVAFGKDATGRLVLGDSPYVAPLRTLDVADKPIFTAFLPTTRGVLDDYFESWFLTMQGPPVSHGESLESVVGLGTSQEWLAPPNLHVGARR